MCRLDQNTVTMALRSFLFAILIHVDSRRLLYESIQILRLLAINILNTLSKYAYFHAK